MIISPPFLPARGANDTDEQWVNAAMPMDAPAQGIPSGVFPVSRNLGWHGGVHLVAPPSVNGAVLPVRAIADGQVIYVRQPTAATTDPADPRNYNPDAPGVSRTDDGCVVIVHESEIGANAANAATPIRFYSIYMHLSSVTCATQTVGGQAQVRQPPFSINRKDEIGSAGRIYGQADRIHFEIVFDDTTRPFLLGRDLTPSPGPDAQGRPRSRNLDLAANVDGRSDAVFGEIYFRLPQTSTFYATQPDANVVAPTTPGTTPLQADMIVGMRFGAGQGAVADRGDITWTSYQLDGTTIGLPITENEGEYNLYTSANTIVQRYQQVSQATPQPPPPPPPAPGQAPQVPPPWPPPVPNASAVYELLRYGRIVDTTNQTLDPSDVPIWKEVRHPGGQGWVNLRATGVQVYSDADLPQWKGWKIIDSDSNTDSRCDSQEVHAILDQDGNGTVTPAEANTRIGDATVRGRFSKLICWMPTEWDAAEIDTRWGWLKNTSPENPTPMSNADFDLFKKHVQALCFWDTTVFGIPAIHWHIHPVEFIKHFRNCGWVGLSALSRIYPGTTDVAILERYRNDLNRVMRRYGLNAVKRGSHFFGQGAVESIGLRCMVEGSASFARNPNHASYQSEANGFYSDPRDLYGYFHRYERTNNGLGNMVKSDLRNASNQNLPVVLVGTSPPVVQSPAVADVDANLSRTGDGMKFRGRGFKQLTGLFNYSEYWVYRGWLSRSDFDANWWDPRHPTRRAPQINDPQLISTEPYNCIDSGGQFAARNGIARPADQGVTRADADAVSQIVNRWDAGSFDRRFNGTTRAHGVLGP